MTARSPSEVSPFARKLVRVDAITVGEGFERDLRLTNIDMLAAIVQRYGLRDPITITNEHELVAGARWLAAVKKLGWEIVEVAIVDGAS
jgi:ParB family transcriptional regulator, chromosome partitioning protein